MNCVWERRQIRRSFSEEERLVRHPFHRGGDRVLLASEPVWLFAKKANLEWPPLNFLGLTSAQNLAFVFPLIPTPVHDA